MKVSYVIYNIVKHTKQTTCKLQVSNLKTKSHKQHVLSQTSSTIANS